MKLERMELADCTTPDLLVTGLLRQMPDLPLPVPIAEIALQLDIREICEVETDGFEGGLITFEDKSEGTILVNRHGNRQRRRFTIGHELGHFLNPWHKPRTTAGFRCTTRDMRISSARPNDRAAQMEVEANSFAAGILLPLPIFRKDLAKLKAVDVEHILQLAIRYDTSKEATARRYVEEHDEPCAAVVSQKGTLLRCYRHKSFPFVDFKNGDPVPRASATARKELAEGEIANWAAVDGGLWLGSERGSRTQTIYEQVLGQQSGFRLTLLTLEDDETAEDDDTEDGLEESWTPRFRRR